MREMDARKSSGMCVTGCPVLAAAHPESSIAAAAANAVDVIASRCLLNMLIA